MKVWVIGSWFDDMEGQEVEIECFIDNEAEVEALYRDYHERGLRGISIISDDGEELY